MLELIVFILLLTPVLTAYLWWKLFNTPSGERYLKMRMQGPFAPTGDEQAKTLKSSGKFKEEPTEVHGCAGEHGDVYAGSQN